MLFILAADMCWASFELSLSDLICGSFLGSNGIAGGGWFNFMFSILMLIKFDNLTFNSNN